MAARWNRVGVAVAAFAIASAPQIAAGNWTLTGWNNLGMHCMDADFAVFSLLPPYNTIHAQLIDAQGHLVTDPTGYTITYEGIADPDGSINTTSVNKTNFWDHAADFFGAAPPIDVGLTGVRMPGAANVPQPMTFDPTYSWFIAEGIPLTPYDDAHNRNPYPLMHLVARNQSGTVLATTDIVLPVSDEMSCTACHASTSGPAAQPALGWVNDADPQRDFRLNILRLHDERQAADPAFQTALLGLGFNPGGLEATVTQDNRSILCASCHASVALGAGGQPGVEALTRAIHSHHAPVEDPVTHLTLDSTDDRSACYRCHPGSVTRCLRGAMGAAVAADGTLAMQCQSCHGTMSTVGAPTRTGWLNEPVCQSCHTGTATANNGQIRYTSAFETSGQPRVAVDQTFATSPDVPGVGLSLFRFSAGHGGLTCEACHGSTHAEFPSSHRNDNIRSLEQQGHIGMSVECKTCHAGQPSTINGGPHGMHPLGQTWVDLHPGMIGEGGNASQCRACHGVDYRGTVLSRSKADRTLTAFGTKVFWRGFQIGCYTCHAGPGEDNPNPNRAPVTTNGFASTAVNAPVTISLSAHDADQNPLTYRIVSQPSHGTVGLTGAVADFFPDADFAGIDTFTFAAWDGSTDSNLGTVTVNVGGVGGCAPTTSADDLCGRRITRAVGRLVRAVEICHQRQASAAFNHTAFDEEACESGDPTHSAKGKFDAALARLNGSCSAAALANANAIRDQLLSGPQSLDTRNGALYCDLSSGTPIDPGGDDAGYVPSTGAALECGNSVAQDMFQFVSGALRCERQWAHALYKGRTFVFDSCQATVAGRSATHRDNLVMRGGCPACLDGPGQDAIRNALQAQVVGMRALIFPCAAP